MIFDVRGDSMSTGKRIFARAGVLAILIAGLGAPMAVAKPAAPSCQVHGIGSNGVVGTCSNLINGESFAAYVDCAGGYRNYGPWRSSSTSASTVYCNGSDPVVGSGVDWKTPV